jgi:ubiquinone/menaquinone biosynthesis C-methylase UbiE
LQEKSDYLFSTSVQIPLIAPVPTLYFFGNMLDKKTLIATENQSFQSQEFFNEQWKVYQKILDNNYMGHHEIYSVLEKFLLSYFQQPLKMLDLGCGDASFSAQALLNSTITSYQGIDLSIPALEIAKDNMGKIQCDTTFTQGNFSELIPELMLTQRHSFDAILCSFALHHLSLEEKDLIISQIKELLTFNGVFILIDVFRQAAEDRETYLRRYLQSVRQDWSLLTSQEYLLLENHISTSDFPETQQTFHAISQKYNFSRFECLCDNVNNATQILCFYR